LIVLVFFALDTFSNNLIDGSLEIIYWIKVLAYNYELITASKGKKIPTANSV